MKVLAGILYLTWEDLQELGVPYMSISSGVKRYRAGSSSSWRSVQDPDDRRRSLVDYDTIPGTTFKKYGLPTAKSLLEQAEANSAGAMQRELQEMLPACPKEDVAYLHGYRIPKQEMDIKTGEMRVEFTAGLPEAVIQEYIMKCRWLKLMAQIVEGTVIADRVLRVAGKMAQLQKLQAMATNSGVELPSAYTRLLQKVKQYASEGAAAVVSKKYGNQNSNKISGTGLEFLIYLLSDSRKFDANTIAQMYNEHAVKTGAFEVLSTSAIRYNMARPEVKQQWYGERNGYKAFANTYGHELSTRKASFRDALWVIDGTKVNLFYRSADGRAKAQLNMVVVMDAYSGTFLGWAIQEKEDSEAIAKAMYMALKHTGMYAPHQVLYDNDASNIKFFANWQGGGFPAMPYNGKSKPIERAFGRYQDSVLRTAKNFTGMNITARSERARVNDEAIKISSLPTREEAIMQAEKSLRTYNLMVNPVAGASPLALYESSKHTVALGHKIEGLQEVMLFWQWRARAVTYSNAGITLENNGARLQYEVYSNEGIPDATFVLKHIGRSFYVRQNVLGDGNSIALFTGETQETARFVAFANSKIRVARALVDMQGGEREFINASLNTRKAAVKLAKDAAKERKERLAELLGDGIEDPLLARNKEAQLNAEALMLEEQLQKREQLLEDLNEEPVLAETPKKRLLTAAERAAEAYKKL